MPSRLTGDEHGRDEHDCPLADAARGVPCRPSIRSIRDAWSGSWSWEGSALPISKEGGVCLWPAGDVRA